MLANPWHCEKHTLSGYSDELQALRKLSCFLMQDDPGNTDQSTSAVEETNKVNMITIKYNKIYKVYV